MARLAFSARAYHRILKVARTIADLAGSDGHRAAPHRRGDRLPAQRRGRGMRICIIGAGPSGIAGAKNLLDADLSDIVVYDRGFEVGGNWVFDAASDHASVFETTRSISSKGLSQYCDYPMPRSYPHYPSHRELAAYFQGYARHFGLDPFLRFGTTVERCERAADGRWLVTTRREGVRATEPFDQLVVANGHHWRPRWPDYPGRYTGEYLHAHGYKRAAPFAGRRVLVIGGGNSACDIAVALVGVAASVDLSWRRGYYILPKFMLGVPFDLFHEYAPGVRRHVPSSVVAFVNRQLWRGARFSNAVRGLPVPYQPLSATHPTINADLPRHVSRRRIRMRRDVARFDGADVRFVDGEHASYDAVIAGTGYVISHPFFAPDLIDYSHGKVPLYLRMIHPQLANLHFLGLFQPIGCVWTGAELQAKIMARRLTGQWRPPADLAAAVAEELARPDYWQVDSPRHTIGVDGPAFQRRLRAQLPRYYVSTEPRSAAGPVATAAA